MGADVNALTWLGEAGEVGLPLVVDHPEPVFLDLVEHLVEAEQCRMLITNKRLRRVAEGARKK